MSRAPHLSQPASPHRKPAMAALLAQALRSLAEGVIITERCPGRPGFVVVFANPAFYEMTGYAPAELIGAAHRFAHHSASDLPRLRGWHRRPAAAAPLSGEGYLKHRNGVRLYASWTFSAIPDAAGRVTRVVGSYCDRTEKRQLQDALVHAQRLDAVGRLAGGIAHDFNNLLSVISGYGEILATTVADNPKAKREVAEIQQAARRASTLVRQLLAFGRRQAMNLRVVNLDRLVRDNAGILTRLLGPPDRSLQLCLDSADANVRADPHQLQQILLNLTLNARDALPEGGMVTISTGRRIATPARGRAAPEMPAGRYVVLAVSDNGTGMDAITRDHIFEPFFTTKGEGEGTGLGLALVHGVVRQSSGYIFVHSAPGVGTTFEILLPEVSDSAVCVDGLLPPLPAAPQRERVVLVEADVVVRKMVTGMLTTDGYRITAASSAAALLAQVGREVPFCDLAILDGTRTSRDASLLIRSLLRANPRLRVIRSMGQPGQPLGVIGRRRQRTLARPFALSTLLQAARDLLEADDEHPAPEGSADSG